MTENIDLGTLYGFPLMLLGVPTSEVAEVKRMVQKYFKNLEQAAWDKIRAFNGGVDK